MSMFSKHRAVACLVLVLGVGAACAPAAVSSPSAVGSPSVPTTPTDAAPSSPVASASSVADASPTLRPNALPPGPTTLVDPDFGVATMTITVPEGGSGWTSDGLGLWKDYGPSGLESGPVIIVWPGGISGTYADPCTDHTVEQPYPTTIETLIAALADQPGITSEPPVDVMASGYRGQYVDTTVTQDISKCGNGEDGFWLWNSKNTDRRYVQDTGEVNRMYAFDVDGKIHTFDVRLPPATTDADRAEVMAMLETIALTPGVSPSPAP
jgi:hypothetical protein